jgi:nicotinamidase-related amidase
MCLALDVRVDVHRTDTAVVVVDPRNAMLGEDGVGWLLVRESLRANDVIANMERLFRAAKTHGFAVFVSPAGVDVAWLPRFAPFIDDGETVVPPCIDLVRELRARRIAKVILGGVLAHAAVARELLVHGFQVAVARDATAAPIQPEWGPGHGPAIVNYASLAHAVWTTAETVAAMQRAA